MASLYCHPGSIPKGKCQTAQVVVTHRQLDNGSFSRGFTLNRLGANEIKNISLALTHR